MAVVVVLGPAQITAASTTEDTTPPTEAPTTEQPDDTTDDTDPADEQSEPSEVSPFVWIGVILLVGIAIVWAVRHESSSTSSASDDESADVSD